MKQKIEWVEIDGSSLRHATLGKGPPLVFLPSLGGSVEVYEALLREFARHATVHVVEPRGSGASDEPDGLPSTRTLAKDVIGVLEALSLTRVDLFGLSLGGMIAQWVAVDAPSRIATLTLASTATRGIETLADPDARNLAFARSLLTSSEPGVDMIDVVLDGNVTREVEAAAAEAVRQHPPRRSTLLWLAAAAAAHDAREALPAVDAAMLLLYGTRDRIFTDETQHELRQSLPKADVRTFDAGHDLGLEVPAEVAQAHRAWIRELVSS